MEEPSGQADGTSAGLISDAEVNALLGDEKSAVPGAARPYDLAAGQRIIRGQLPTLDAINERLCLNLRTGLQRFLQRDVEVQLARSETRRYADYLAALKVPSSLNLLRSPALTQAILVVLEPALLASLVELLFGGAGAVPTRRPEREFTVTELRVAQRLVEQVQAALDLAWQPVLRLATELEKSESNPHFLGLMGPGERLLLTRLTVQAPGCEGSIDIAVPMAAIEPHRMLLASGPRHGAAGGPWGEILRARLDDTELVLRGVFTETQLSLRELAELVPGDVIPVEAPSLVRLCVDEVTVLKGKFGVSNGYNAVRVVAAGTGAMHSGQGKQR